MGETNRSPPIPPMLTPIMPAPVCEGACGAAKGTVRPAELDEAEARMLSPPWFPPVIAAF